jgi:hypothetical protein
MDEDSGLQMIQQLALDMRRGHSCDQGGFKSVTDMYGVQFDSQNTCLMVAGLQSTARSVDIVDIAAVAIIAATAK